MLKKEYLAHGALIIVNLIYGINFLVAKEVMPRYIVPSGFIFVRVSVTALMFLLLWLLFTRERIDWKDFPRIILCAITGVATNQLLFYEGLNLTTPINAAVIFTSNPVLTLLASMLILRERITPVKFAGIALGGLGAVALIIFGRGKVSLDSNTHLGNLFIFLNALSYAIYLVIAKPLMLKYKPLTVITANFLVGFLFVFPFGWKQFNEIQWSTFHPQIWVGVIFTVIGTTFIAYLFSIYALQSLKAHSVSIYVYIQPVTAALLASFYGKDFFTPETIVCTVLVFVGVYLVLRK
jgi:drug/metabolite transporter (DMT)-like permease